MTKKDQKANEKSRRDNDKLVSIDEQHALANIHRMVRAHEDYLYRLAWLERTAENAEKEVAKFASDLAEDAADAMRWADGPMAAAMKAAVIRKFLMIVDNYGPDAALRSAHDEAMRGAKFPSQSTSAASNFTERAATAQWAELTEWSF